MPCYIATPLPLTHFSPREERSCCALQARSAPLRVDRGRLCLSALAWAARRVPVARVLTTLPDAGYVCGSHLIIRCARYRRSFALVRSPGGRALHAASGQSRRDHSGQTRKTEPSCRPLASRYFETSVTKCLSVSAAFCGYLAPFQTALRVDSTRAEDRGVAEMFLGT